MFLIEIRSFQFLGRRHMEYRAELERVATYFQSVPGRLNKSNLKHLVTLNHFEIFEDPLPDGGVRLSLSGSIVVIDVDFVNGQVTAVSVSLASMPSQKSKFSFMSEENHPESVIMDSFKLPRLDQFAQILEFLSRCDRYSTKEVDCFRALDELSSAICTYVSNTMHPSVESGFGIPEINPGRLGLGLWYFGSESHKRRAFIDAYAGSRKEFALYLNQNWLNAEGDWAEVDKTQFVPRDVRAESVLLLVPPVIMRSSVATRLKAEISNKSIALNERRQMSSFSIERHPAFSSQQTSDDIDITIANLLPCDFVEVTTIPISSPQDIPSILSALRRDSVALQLIQSVLKGPALLNSGDADLSIADALGFKDKPVFFNSRDVSMSLLESENEGLVLVGVLAQGALSFEIKIQESIEVSIRGHDEATVNKNDLLKLLQAGQLDYAISYVIGSLQLNQRKGSMSR